MRKASAAKGACQTTGGGGPSERISLNRNVQPNIRSHVVLSNLYRWVLPGSGTSHNPLHATHIRPDRLGHTTEPSACCYCSRIAITRRGSATPEPLRYGQAWFALGVAGRDVGPQCLEIFKLLHDETIKPACCRSPEFQS